MRVGKGYVGKGVRGEGVCGDSVLSSQLPYEPKTVLKNKVH